MKINAPKNANYAAVIARVPALLPLKGRDRIVGLPLFGSHAIVQKNWQVGDLGVYFPAEVQFSDDYAHHNNLYRDSTKNADTTEAGYLEDNRRLKAIKLGGHRSDAMFMPLSSLAWTGINLDDLREGDTFDTLNGHDICGKYQITVPVSNLEKKQQKATRKFNRVDAKFLPEHPDSDNYWRNQHLIDDNADIVVTQKLHGTSLRAGMVPVRRRLNWFERFLIWIGVAELG